MTLDEIIKLLPEPKSILAMAAYQGADVPKKWIHEMGLYCKGYNKALEDMRKAVLAAREAES